jgi:Flp pilus assembly CpaF family ATPase
MTLVIMSAQRLLEAFSNPGVIEILINDDGTVYLERTDARLELQPFLVGASDIDAFLKVILGRAETFGPARPYGDLSAKDGSRVHVIAPPLVRGGLLCVCVRKRPKLRPSLEELTAGRTLSLGCASFLKFAVLQRKNILIIGGASSGKTTLLNALTAQIPAMRASSLWRTRRSWLFLRAMLSIFRRACATQGGCRTLICAILFSTHCACGRTASSSVRCAASKPWTCSRP